MNSIGFDPTDVLFAGDVNADGLKDLILFARKQGKVYVALSDGEKLRRPARLAQLLRGVAPSSGRGWPT